MVASVQHHTSIISSVMGGKVDLLQLQQRLEIGFSATEQYPLQLHEMHRTAYIDMKLSEYSRQRTLQ